MTRFSAIAEVYGFAYLIGLQHEKIENRTGGEQVDCCKCPGRNGNLLCCLLFSFSCSLAVARALIHPSSACDLHHTQVESALKNGHIKTKGTLLVHESRLKESKKQQSNTFSSRALLRRRQCLLIHDAMFYSCQCGVLAAERPPTLLFSVKFLFHFAFSFFTHNGREPNAPTSTWTQPLNRLDGGRVC